MTSRRLGAVARTSAGELGDPWDGRYGARPPAVTLDELAGADPVDRYLAADWRARHLSKDPDARAARLLAAELNLFADELEGASTSRLPSAATDRDRALAQKRKRVRALRRLWERVDRDQWIALEWLVREVERLARTPRLEHRFEGDVDHLLRELRAAWPREAERVDRADVVATIAATRAPKKGAPKWKAFVTIAKPLVGETDATVLRKELSRLDARRRT